MKGRAVHPALPHARASRRRSRGGTLRFTWSAIQGAFLVLLVAVVALLALPVLLV